MKTRTQALATACLFLGISACASLEPEPCTAEWVDWQKERIFEDFAAGHRKELRALRDLRDTTTEMGTIEAIRLVGMAPDIAEMAQTFSERTVPSIRSAVAQCASTPASGAALLTEFLRSEGVSDEALMWISTIGVMIEISQSQTNR